MVAGVKGVVFLDHDTMAVSSSTESELFLVSRKEKRVKRCVKLGEGVKAESLCVVPGTKRVLVADGAGKLCSVDLGVDPAAVTCVATYDLRLTSVCALDSKTAFVAGAVRNEKTKCSVRRVNCETGEISEEAMLEAPMIRALHAQHSKNRVLAGAIDVASDDAADSHTEICAWSAADDFKKHTVLAKVDGFVHAIAPHPHYKDAYVCLGRHSGSAFDAPVSIVRLGDETKEHAGKMLLPKLGVTDTLPSEPRRRVRRTQ